MDERALLRRMFDAAIAAASPDNAVPLHLPPPPRGRTIVVGAGKAAACDGARGRGALASPTGRSAAWS